MKNNKMASMPVNRLMLSMGIPMILSMVLQAVYNIVDSAFVSNMAEHGEEAMCSLTLAFPVQMLMTALSIGTGVGANALLSKALGMNDRKTANKAAGNAAFLAALIYLLFLLFGIFGVRPYIATQTSDKLIADMAVDYLGICSVISFGIVFFAIYEKLLQATGHSLCSTIAQIAGAVTNIILDPIMIYGYFGCPKMGVKGAAYATVIGQIVSFALAFIFHIKFNKDISNSLKHMKPSAEIIGRIYAVGLPAIIAQALMSLMTYGLNIILAGVGKSAVTAYGLYYKIQQFLLFAAFGMRDAVTPIVSYAHGMKSKSRIKAGIKYGIIYTTAVMIFGIIIIEIFAEPFTGIFGLSGETRRLCTEAMQIISVSLVFAGINITFQGVFQATNKGIESLIISACRQLIFVLPLAWALSRLVADRGFATVIIWTTFPVAEVLTAVIGLILMKKLYKNEINKMA